MGLNVYAFEALDKYEKQGASQAKRLEPQKESYSGSRMPHTQGVLKTKTTLKTKTSKTKTSKTTVRHRKHLETHIATTRSRSICLHLQNLIRTYRDDSFLKH